MPAGHKILLIDDDAISREVMQLTLEMHGMVVETAEDGAEALARLQDGAFAPDIILMDTQMPGVSGVDLVKALRAASKARIVAISGSEVGEAIRQVTDGFLLKPVEIESLLALAEEPKTAKTAKASKTAAKKTTPRETIAISAAADRSSRSGNPAMADVIDLVVLGKLKAMMPASAVLEIYTAVAADLETRIPALEAAVVAKDLAEARRVAHAIKGSCAMVGLKEATAAASRIETGNLPESGSKELLQLNAALSALRGILYDRLL